MKRKLTLALALLLCMSMLIGLAACGGDDPATTTDNPPTDAPPTDAPPTDAPPTDPPPSADDPPLEDVELTMASWRTDDVAAVTDLLAKYKALVPNVTITFQPVNPPDYNSTLEMQLEAGTAADLMYARSYDVGQGLFNKGYLADCTGITGLMDNFAAGNLAPWQMPDGKMFAVPFAAVSHGVYYNKDIFADKGVSVPNTWAEFIDVCKTLKDAGVTPIANGIADNWDILECFFLSMVSNYVGVGATREQYENGDKKFSDDAWVKAYTAIAEAAPYLPSGFQSVTYDDMMALFASGGAAMAVDGSWTISVYDDVPFEWGVFAVPGPNDSKNINFHPDMAIGYNNATKYPEECKAFLAWLCTQEGASTASAALPTGFFPMIDFSIQLTDPHANEFLALNSGREPDARFVWPKLMFLYGPMLDAVNGVLTGSLTPQAAADAVQTAYENPPTD
ncbi:MAG: extracellular solute-binding protein [Oscillospiraceae bacterium]|nr:extracellular solute-binding protein [Oscillospiraceae bacterium]